MTSGQSIQLLPPQTDAQAARLAHQAQVLADLMAVSAIHCEALPARNIGGQSWRDITPMLDAREVSLTQLDINRVLLDYAQQRGLIALHPQSAHLVRFTRSL